MSHLLAAFPSAPHTYLLHTQQATESEGVTLYSTIILKLTLKQDSKAQTKNIQ